MQGEAAVEAYSLLLLGSVALTQSEDTEGVAMIEQALVVACRIGHGDVQSECLVWLGDAARWRGDYVTAQGFYEAGLAAARPLGRVWLEASAAGMMAELALLQDDRNRARSLAREALQGYIEVGDKTYCVLILDTFAGLALAESDPARAACLLAFVDALTRALQTPLPLPEQETHLRRLKAAQTVLDSETFRTMYAFGYQMSWEQVVAYALEDLTPAPSP